MRQQKAAQATSGVFSVNDFCHWADIGRTAVYAELKWAAGLVVFGCVIFPSSRGEFHAVSLVIFLCICFR
jgi:hypothetical protein